MTLAVLAVIALSQLVFLLALTLFIFSHRLRLERRLRARAVAQSRLAPVLRDWLIGIAPVTTVRDLLASLPSRTARDAAMRMSQSSLPAESASELAVVVRGAPWYAVGIAQAGSSLWWRRLEAARLIAEIGTMADEPVVRRLLRDPHAAVRVSASAALRRTASPGLIELVLDELPDQPLVVRSYQLILLREQWRFAREALLVRIDRHASAMALPLWINVVEALELPDLLARVALLVDHPAPAVRIAVARALRKYFHPSTIVSLLQLLRDPDWRVRAQAARSLGVIADPSAVAPLADALNDVAWWVRFRSALALSQLGEPGRASLRTVRDTGDPYAGQMAALVSGLSPGSAVELIEG
jgi:HEAT repeat protein